MASPVPELAPHLATALKAFREAGVNPTDEEIVWLAELRRACDHPVDGSIPWLIGAPFRYAGVDWYPIHHLAELWFIRAKKLMNTEDVPDIAHTAAFLFAHAHSGVGDVTVQSVLTLPDIVQRCTEWFDCLPLHAGHILPLVNRLRELDRNVSSVPDGPDNDMSDEVLANQPAGVAIMMKAFPGTTPDDWLTRVSAADGRDYVSAVSDGGGNFATGQKRTQAITNWLRAVKWVWRNHSE